LAVAHVAHTTGTYTVGAAAPALAEYVPAAHAVQLVEPASENVPAEQLMQTAEADAPENAEYLPAAHGLQALAPVKEAKVPAMQLVQLEASASEENIPAPQWVHVKTLLEL